MSQYVSDLEDLAKQWGKAFSKHYGTTCRWIDLHASRSEMANYKKYKIGAKVENVRYEGHNSVIDLPGQVVTEMFPNDTSQLQKTTFKNTKSTTSSFTWSIKEAINVGISLEVKVGVPPIASATTTITTNLSFESTQQKTKTETETWEITREILVSPRTQIEMIWTITEKQSSATFYGDVILTGYIAIWNKNKIDVNMPGGNNRHWLWFIPIDRAFREMQEWGIGVPSNYSINYGSVTYRASGEFQGKSGFGTIFQLKERHLMKSSEMSEVSGEVKVITEVGIPATSLHKVTTVNSNL